jgi:hypothetical protein
MHHLLPMMKIKTLQMGKAVSGGRNKVDPNKPRLSRSRQGNSAGEISVRVGFRREENERIMDFTQNRQF